MAYSVRHVVARAPKAPRTFSTLEKDRIHNTLTRMTPSDPWRQFCTVVVYDGRVPMKRKLAREFYRLGIFPPGGSSTLMAHCRMCGDEMWHPPQSVEGSGHGKAGVCDHCREVLRISGQGETSGITHRRSTSSITRRAVDAMRDRGVALEEDLAPEFKLRTEDESMLRAQVDRYIALAAAKIAATPTSKTVSA